MARNILSFVPPRAFQPKTLAVLLSIGTIDTEMKLGIINGTGKILAAKYDHTPRSL
jgi:hypothetical protein